MEILTYWPKHTDYIFETTQPSVQCVSGLSWGVKWLDHGTVHPPQTASRLSRMGSYTSMPHSVPPMACYGVILPLGTGKIKLTIKLFGLLVYYISICSPYHQLVNPFRILCSSDHGRDSTATPPQHWELSYRQCLQHTNMATAMKLNLIFRH